MKIILYTFFVLFFSSASAFAGEKGALVGRVLDEDNLPLPGANIVLPDLNTGAAADKNGEFRLSPLPPGKHAVVVMFIGFQSVRDTVLIRAGETTTLNVVMHSGVVELGEVMVVGERLKGQAKALNQQKTNFNVTNVISADQIGRFPDQNIGDALKRIPAITVNYNQGEARYANIRGTGPSLNAVTIDGEGAASADAETRAVQLDLIPADMIQSIEVNKTITPDMDAEAIGGSVNLVTRQAPYLRRLSFTLGSGYNALTRKPMLNGAFIIGQRFYHEKFGLVLSGSWDDHRLGSHNTEGIWDFDDKGRIYPKQWDVRLYEIRRLRKSLSAAADYRINDDNRFFFNVMVNQRDDWENRVRLRYRLNPPTKKGVSKKSRVRRQTKGGAGDRNKNARLEAQQTTTVRLKGKHNVGDLFQAEWSLSFGGASEERPRERYFSWEAGDVPVRVDLGNPRTPYFYEQTPYEDFRPEEISEEYRNTSEQNRRFKIDIDLPIVKKGRYKNVFYLGGKMKFKTKKRDQNFERIKLTDAGKERFSDMTKTELKNFTQDHFLAGDYQLGLFTTYGFLGSLDFTDTTLFNPKDDPAKYIAGNYSAQEDVSSAYFMFEQNVGKDVEIKAGLRVEQTRLDYRGFAYDEEQDAASPTGGADNYANWLPGVHLKFEPNKKTTIRLAWSNTLARPNYYDLVPYRSVSRGGEVLRIGNPYLRPTTSRNFDFMIERYAKSVGILSLGLFSKTIDHFIYVHKENDYTDPRTGVVYDEFYQPRNGAEALLNGAEIAFQRQLTFLPGVLSNLGFYFNYTFTHSRADSPTLPKTINLPGAAPHTLNVNVTYETKRLAAGLSFNYSSPYLDPDEVDLTPGLERYYDRVAYLDFNASYRASSALRFFFEANNLLNQPLRYYAGEPGRTYQQEFYNFRIKTGLKYDFE